jgi:hypothetical protein
VWLLSLVSFAMSKKILYGGDTSLSTAASYLAGVLTYRGLDFDYLASDQPIGPALSGSKYGLYIISDYPVNNWGEEDFSFVKEAVKEGAGLLMIGGWESFHGLAGEYNGSPLEEVLPVEILKEDDRVNSSQPWVIEKKEEHPIVEGLPFEESPSYVGGFNRFLKKEESTEVLRLRQAVISYSSDKGFTFEPGESVPLLLAGSYGAGRTAAFASDVAPHWVGGFVDWGERRILAQAEGSDEVEVGSDYAAFFWRLAEWTGRFQMR